MSVSTYTPVVPSATKWKAVPTALAGSHAVTACIVMRSHWHLACKRTLALRIVDQLMGRGVARMRHDSGAGDRSMQNACEQMSRPGLGVQG